MGKNNKNQDPSAIAQEVQFAGQQGAPMMHVPEQPETYGQDAEIYNMIKGKRSIDGKRTYYTPFSKVLLKILCFILIPVIAIYAAVSFTKSRYFPTNGEFSITITTDTKSDGPYKITQRYTKRFEIEEVEFVAIDDKGNKQTTRWEGYKIQTLAKAAGFSDDPYNYFSFLKADGTAVQVVEDTGITEELGPHFEHYYIFIYKIVNGQRRDVYGNELSPKKQPTSYIITDPRYNADAFMFFDITEIHFGSKSYSE
ncbi:MAG: hypothetical protein LBT20_00900 [Clostridiales bacterium]|jgi:hypothetical protein|nr:hypothetical protein [Clostridiales bacterium]